MSSRGKQKECNGEKSLMEENNETTNQETEMKKKTDPVNLGEVKEKSHPMATNDLVTDERRAEETCALFVKHYEAPRKAFEAADRAFCEARVKCGEVVFKYMFENDTSRIGKKIFKPVHIASYNMLLAMRNFPVKSKTGVKNIVYLGYQSVWLQERGVDLKELMAQGKVGYTHLVRLSEMPYDQRKVELMEVIANRDKPFTVKELEDEIKKKLKKQEAATFPPDFEQVMSHGWIPQVIKEKIALVTKGIEIGEEATEKVLREFFADMEKVIEHGYDAKSGILKARGEEMVGILRDTQKKAQDYISYINRALRKIEEKNKDKGEKDKNVA